MIANVINFMKDDIWRIRTKELPKVRSFFIRHLRTFILSVRQFGTDKCALHAASLTFFHTPLNCSHFGDGFWNRQRFWS